VVLAFDVMTSKPILTITKIFFITLYFTSAFSSRETALSFRISVQNYEDSVSWPNIFWFFKKVVCAHTTAVCAHNAIFTVNKRKMSFHSKSTTVMPVPPNCTCSSRK
jgi:hypothetical protein